MNEYYKINEYYNIKTANERAVATAGWNMTDADFWIIGKGDGKVIGKPTEDRSIIGPSYIGIKVLTPEKINPKYLFYLFQHLQYQGEFSKLAKGTLNLKHITLSDVKSVLNRLQFAK